MLDVSTQKRPVLHRDLSGHQEPVMHQDVSTAQVHLEISTVHVNGLCCYWMCLPLQEREH